MCKGHHASLICFAIQERIQDLLTFGANVLAHREVNEGFPVRGSVLCSDCGQPLTSCWLKRPEEPLAVLSMRFAGPPFQAQADQACRDRGRRRGHSAQASTHQADCCDGESSVSELQERSGVEARGAHNMVLEQIRDTESQIEAFLDRNVEHIGYQRLQTQERQAGAQEVCAVEQNRENYPSKGVPD